MAKVLVEDIGSHALTHVHIYICMLTFADGLRFIYCKTSYTCQKKVITTLKRVKWNICIISTQRLPRDWFS
jgi:hypothetical protein